MKEVIVFECLAVIYGMWPAALKFGTSLNRVLNAWMIVQRAGHHARVG